MRQYTDTLKNAKTTLTTQTSCAKLRQYAKITTQSTFDLRKPFTSNNKHHKLTLERSAASWPTYYSKYFMRQHFNFPLFYHHRLFSLTYFIIHTHLHIQSPPYMYNIFTILNSQFLMMSQTTKAQTNIKVLLNSSYLASFDFVSFIYILFLFYCFFQPYRLEQ